MEDQDQPAQPGATGPSVWRFVRASRAHIVVDAADYFKLMQQAMLGARQRILMIGWDFDTRVRLGQAGAGGMCRAVRPIRPGSAHL